MNPLVLNFLCVALGGAAGAVCRYSVTLGVHRFVEEPWVPFGTIIVNVLGCFLIGVMSGLQEARDLLSPQAHALLVIGLFGGFTTFSTFGYELFTLARHSQYLAAAVNFSVQVVFGIGAVWLGHYLTRAG